MSTTKKKDGFTAEEKAAMRARARELQDQADGESAVRAACALSLATWLGLPTERCPNVP